MVKLFYCVTYLLLSLSIAFAGTDKITGNDLKQLLSPSESEHARHKNDLNADELHLLLKKKREQNKTFSPGSNADGQGGWPSNSDPKAPGGSNATGGAADQPGKAPNSSDPSDSSSWPGQSVEKNGSAQPGSRGLSGSSPSGSRSGASGGKPRKTRKASYRRLPPGWDLSSSSGGQQVKILSDNGDKDSVPLFGIRRGSEIRAKLVRSTTNVDPALAEFETTSDLFGDYLDLPAGTQIFLNKQVATGSNRLFFTASGNVNTITPDSKEFSIACTVTDITVNRQAGLVGAITTDQKLIQRSLSSGAFAAGKSVVGSLGGGVAAEVVGSAAESALTEKESESSASLGAPTFVISVSPQEVYIRIDKSF